MAPTGIADLNLGMSVQVIVNKQKLMGWVRFLGATEFAEGDWVGVELEEPKGKNDGSVKDRSYFSCKAEHGLFVRPACVEVKAKARKTLLEAQDARNLRLALAEAVEENDVQALRRLLPEAKAKQLQKEEVELAERRLAGLREEPDPEDKPLIDLLGGQGRVAEFRKSSERIRQRVAESLRAGEAPAMQPAIFQGMGLENMLKLAGHSKRIFDALCRKLTEDLEAHLKEKDIKGYGVAFCAASVKSLASAASKVSTEYHGDCRQLKDVVRGTLVIKCENINENTIGVAYEMLETLAGSTAKLREFKAHFTRFSDRYQKPVGALKYRDWLFLLKIGDFICELQVNFEKAVQVKEDVQHHIYEKERLGTRKLLEAAMSNDENMVRLLFSTDIDRKQLVAARDCHGFMPLHYAARHGSRSMIEHLVEAGADVAAVDSEGHPALFHAVMMEHEEASRILLEKMLSLPKKSMRVPGLQDSLQAIWGAVCHSCSEGMGMLAQQTQELAKNAYPKPLYQIRGIARSGDLLAMEAAMKKISESDWDLARNKLKYEFESGQIMTLHDQAIASGCAEMVQILGDGDLQRYARGETVQMMAALGDVNRFRARQAVQRIHPDHLVSALMKACEMQQVDMAHAIWSTSETVLDEEQKVKLAELGGDAAGQGNVDFLRVLVEAGVPLDHKVGALSMIDRAASMGHIETVQLLVDAKASVSVDSIACAVHSGRQEVVRMLLPMCEVDGDRTEGLLKGAVFGDRPGTLELLLAVLPLGEDTFQWLARQVEEYGAEDCAAWLEKRSRSLASSQSPQT